MNTYGTLIKTTIYGESHQKGLGVIIDGFPAGINIDLDKIKNDLLLRRPKRENETNRIEADELIVISGIYNGVSTGSPINIMLLNQDIKSDDYKEFREHPRPGHSDFVANHKYHGFNDIRGAGMFSGRLTAAIVIAGSICKMLIPYQINSKIIKVKDYEMPFDLDEYLKEIANQNDSVGGIIELNVSNMDVGLGEPYFNKLDSEIAKILFSIPSIKGVEFGVGFNGSSLLGSEFNDLIIDSSGKTKTNNNGGINAGISNGNDLVVRVFVKPIPSIKKAQQTFNFKNNEVSELKIKGRHDSSIIKRIPIVLESAIAIVLADMMMIQKAYKG